MFSENDRISIRQMQILLVLTLFSSVSLILPRITSEYANQNGWMLIIGGAVLTCIYTVIITFLGKMFPGQTIVEYSKVILTKPIGIILCLILVIQVVLFAGFELRIFGELVKQVLLYRTPIEMIMIVMLFTIVYLTRRGYEERGRFAEIVIFISLIPILSVLLTSLPDIEAHNLAPFFTVKYKEFFSGSYFVSIMMVGIEVLYIGIAYLKNPEKVTRAAISAIIFVTIINLLIFFVTIGIFGAEETKRQIWPLMTIMQVVELPGAFIHRQDALMMSFWILITYALLSNYIFFASILNSRLMKTKKTDWVNMLILPFVYVVALIPDNVPETFMMIKVLINYMSIIFLLPIPLIMLGVAKIRRLGEQNEKKN